MAIPYACRLPLIGDRGETATVERLLVAVGTNVRAGEAVLEGHFRGHRFVLESPVPGRITELRVSQGSRAVPGRPVLWLEAESSPPPMMSGNVAAGSRGEAADYDLGVFVVPDFGVSAAAMTVEASWLAVGQEVAPGTPGVRLRLENLLIDLLVQQSGRIVASECAVGQRVGSFSVLARLDTASAATGGQPQSDAGSEIEPQSHQVRRRLEEFHPYTERLHAAGRIVGDLLRELGAKESADALACELKELSECVFTVAFVGEFKRGKSSLVNAVFGVDVLPSDPTPCTAVATRLMPGPTSEAFVRFQDGHSERIAVADLHGFATKLNEAAAARAARVSMVDVRSPASRLPVGMALMDTPGLNDDDTMAAVTVGIIPAADVAVMTLAVEIPVSETESDFLTEHLLARDRQRLIYAVNGVDRMRTADRVRALDGIRRRLVETLRKASHEGPEPTPEVYPVSALMALDGMDGEDSARVTASGVPALRDRLREIVAEARGNPALTRAQERLMAAIAEARRTIELRLHMARAPRHEAAATAAAVRSVLAELRRVDVTTTGLLHDLQVEAEKQRTTTVDAILKQLTEEARRLAANVAIHEESFTNATANIFVTEVETRLTAAMMTRLGHALHELEPQANAGYSSANNCTEAAISHGERILQRAMGIASARTRGSVAVLEHRAGGDLAGEAFAQARAAFSRATHELSALRPGIGLTLAEWLGRNVSVAWMRSLRPGAIRDFRELISQQATTALTSPTFRRDLEQLLDLSRLYPLHELQRSYRRDLSAIVAEAERALADVDASRATREAEQRAHRDQLLSQRERLAAAESLVPTSSEDLKGSGGIDA